MEERGHHLRQGTALVRVRVIECIVCQYTQLLSPPRLLRDRQYQDEQNQGRERCNWQTDSWRWHLNYCVKV
jgi:hypothetical protein